MLSVTMETQTPTSGNLALTDLRAKSNNSDPDPVHFIKHEISFRSKDATQVSRYSDRTHGFSSIVRYVMIFSDNRKKGISHLIPSLSNNSKQTCKYDKATVAVKFSQLRDPI